MNRLHTRTGQMPLHGPTLVLVSYIVYCHVLIDVPIFPNFHSATIVGAFVPCDKRPYTCTAMKIWENVRIDECRTVLCVR